MTLPRSSIIPGSSAVILASIAAGGIVLPSPAFGQAVGDRTLSDVRVNHVGSCTTLTIEFNIRVQMLSSFPESGQELHVRLRPLDASAPGSAREALRAPENVPELRSIEYDGDNPSGPVLSLFFTRDMRFEIEPGIDPNTLVIRIDEPGSSAICDGRGVAVPPPQFGQPKPLPPGMEIPAGLYVVNLVSKAKSLDQLTPEEQAALSGKIAYETLFERDSEEWHRLRLGFFKTREEAQAAKASLAAQFPEAWVVKVSADERAQGVASRIDTGTLRLGAAKPERTATEAETDQTAKLIGEAEDAIRDGENGRAIQILTNALALPENENTPRALELLGLTRERNGQAAHAEAEYQEYLRRYPQGEAADRVRQRLAALGAPALGESLRPASRSTAPTAWTWGVRGSFSQFYFRDQSTTKFIDASRPEIDPEVDNSVNVNQLLTSGDMTISGGNDRRQLAFRAAGSYTYNFRKGGRDIKSLTALYLDYSDEALRSSIRIGRQTRNSAGVLGRFDGVLGGFQARSNIRLNLVGGFPVLTSRQTHILKERPFYGASVDIGAKRSPLQATFYWFDQRAKGGFIDRRSVGFEGRMLKPRFNAFMIVDYDVEYKKLNLGLLTLNYAFPDNSNLSLTADYRRSPLLTASNALIGQIDTTTFQPITDLRGLRPFFTDPQIYQLALDRTILTKSMTVTFSRPLTEKLQANVDFTLTDTGGAPGTPASVGTQDVFPIPAIGTEYYYGAQLVGTGLFWQNDIYILSGRYADTKRSNAYTVDFNARVPVTSKFRLSPRVRFGYRKDKISNGNFRQLQPTLRMNYYPTRRTEFEVEVGGNFSHRRETIAATANTTKENGFVINVGYRIDF